MPRTVIVVDDEPLLRIALATALTDDGYAVRTAEDGLEALLLHQRHPADVIVADVVMPLIDGEDLVADLRDVGDGTPVVLISASQRPPCHQADTVWLDKPFALDALLAAVADIGGAPTDAPA